MRGKADRLAQNPKVLVLPEKIEIGQQCSDVGGIQFRLQPVEIEQEFSEIFLASGFHHVKRQALEVITIIRTMVPAALATISLQELEMRVATLSRVRNGLDIVPLPVLQKDAA